MIGERINDDCDLDNYPSTQEQQDLEKITDARQSLCIVGDGLSLLVCRSA